MRKKDTKICKQCKSEFTRQTTGTKKCGVIRWSTRLFCSNLCKFMYSRTDEYKKAHPFVKYWTGKTLTEEHKEKMSVAKIGKMPWNKGKRLSPEHVAKLSGENANNWQGGKSTENQLIRHCTEYRLWREAVFTRDNWECQECHDRGKKGHFVVLNADHIKPFALYPELRFAIDNGKTLCAPCHRKTDTFGFRLVNRLKTKIT